MKKPARHRSRLPAQFIDLAERMLMSADVSVREESKATLTGQAIVAAERAHWRELLTYLTHSLGISAIGISAGTYLLSTGQNEIFCWALILGSLAAGSNEAKRFLDQLRSGLSNLISPSRSD